MTMLHRDGRIDVPAPALAPDPVEDAKAMPRPDGEARADRPTRSASCDGPRPTGRPDGSSQTPGT